MKGRCKFLRTTPDVHVIAVLILFSFVQWAAALGTAFTYQGRLSDAGQPANGTYDLTFRLYDAGWSGAQVGNTLTNTAVPVQDGYFTALLDFGLQGLEGTGLWLELGVRTNTSSPGAFVLLAPRQRLTPTPYAITAAQALSFPEGVSNNIAAIAQSQAQAGVAGALSTNMITVNFAGFVSGSGSGSNVVTVTLTPDAEGSNYMAGVAAASIGSASAIDLADGLTINAGRFPYTYSFAATNWAYPRTLLTASPMHVLVIGDSLADLIPLATAFQDNFGSDGCVGGSPLGAVFKRQGDWSTNVVDFTKWFAPLNRLTNGDSARFSVHGIDPFPARSVEIPYIANSDYGRMIVRVISGGVTSSVVTIDTAAGATAFDTLQMTNVDLGSRIMAHLLIECADGVVYFPTPGYASRIQQGVNICNASFGGHGWNHWTNMSPALLASIGAALKPCLIVVQETSDSNAWQLAEGVLTNIMSGQPKCDVLIATPNPWGFPGTPAENIIVNEITVMKELALKRGWVLWDEHKFFGSRTNMVLAGFSLPSDPHPTWAAKLVAARAMFADTGLSVLTSHGQDSGNLILGASSATLTSDCWDFFNRNGSSMIHLSSDGSVQLAPTTINGSLTVYSDIFGGNIIDWGDFTCEGRADFNGNATIQGSLSVGGDAYLGTATIGSALNVYGDIGGGNIIDWGDFTCEGRADFNGNATIQGSLSVGGDAYLGAATIGSALNVCGEFVAGGTARFQGGITNNGITCLNNTNLIIRSVDNPNIAVRIYCNSNGVVMGQIVSP